MDVKPVAEIKCGRLRWHIPAPDYVLAGKFINNDTHPLFDQAALDAAVAAARADERERCAMMIEAYPEWLGPQAKREISAAIRKG